MPLAQRLYTALPIYEELEEQIRFKSYCSETVWQNAIPSNKLPEFAYLRQISPVFTFTMNVKDIDGTTVATFSAASLFPMLNIDTYADGTELIKLSADFDSFGSDEYLANGCYYLQISDGVSTYYSEVFCYTGFVSTDYECYSVLMCVTTCQIGQRYPLGFTQHLYIQNDIGLPEYNYTEEGHEDTDKASVIDWRRVEKMRKFFLRAPEYICDFFSMISMMDQITFTNEVDVINIENATSEITWDEQSFCEARIDVQFVASTVTKNTCCVPLDDLNIENPIPQVTVQAKVDCNEGAWPTSYTPTGGGTDVDFVTGDYVLGCCDGNCFIYKFVNGVFVIQPQLNIQGYIAFDQDSNTYWHYFSGGFNVPYLYLYFQGTSPTGAFRGYAPNGFMAELQRDNGGAWTVISTITSNVFALTGFASATYTLDDYRVRVYNHSQSATTNEVTLS